MLINYLNSVTFEKLLNKLHSQTIFQFNYKVLEQFL